MCITKLFQKDLAGKQRYYFIHKGQHRAKRTPMQPRILSVKDKYLHYQVTVDKSWFYPSEFDVGWNKLPGLSSYRLHTNSARVGWRCTGGKIRIASYCYVDGVRTTIEQLSLKKGDTLDVVIKQEQGDVLFTLNGVSYIQHGFTRNMDWLTHFYFGGTKPAPHHIEATIKFPKH